MISLVIPSLTGSDELNESCEESWRSAATQPIEVVVSESPASFAINVNRGVARATGDIIAVINNDTIGLPGWDSWLVESASKGIVGFSPRADIGWGFGASREIFEDVGNLDSNLINSYEDYDFIIRAALKGYTRVLPNKLYALHEGGATLNELWGPVSEKRSERITQCMRNRAYMERKWPGIQIDAVPGNYWARYGVQLMKDWGNREAVT